MEETIASFSQDTKSLPSTMMFVSGGTFNLATGDSSASTDGNSAGTVIEYKITSKTSTSSAAHKSPPNEASDPHLPESALLSSEIGGLSEEFKRKHEMREAIKADRSKENYAPKTSSSSASTPSNARLTTNLRINGLHGWWSTQVLLHDFSCYGHVLSTKVHSLRFDDRHTTAGYILFANREAAEHARAEKEGTTYAGLPISFEWVPPPSDAPTTRKSKGTSIGAVHREPDIFNSGHWLVADYLKRETSDLEDEDVEEFSALLRDLTASRSSIATAMYWMIAHESGASQVVDMWSTEMFSSNQSAPSLATKIALLFLASDLLFNVSSILKSTHNSADAQSGIAPDLISPEDFKYLWVYQAAFYRVLPAVMRFLGRKKRDLPGRLSAQTFDGYIRSVIASWSKSSLFAPKYIAQLILVFSEPETKVSIRAPEIDLSPLVHIPPASKPYENPVAHDQEGIEGVPIVDYRGLPIDFDAAIDEELERILQRISPHGK